MSEQVDLTDYTEINPDQDSEWIEKSLGNIFNSIYSGGTPKKGTEEYYDGEIPFVKIEDLNKQQGEGVSTAEESITEKAIDETSARAFNPGTLLLTIYGSLAETALVDSRVATNQAILGLWDDDEDNTLYVRYAVDNTEAQLESLSRQTTQANLGKGIVKKHRIPVPPLEEQRKIASVLYNVDQAIQKTEEIIEQTKRIKQGVSQDLFRNGVDRESTKSTYLSAIEVELPEHWEVKSIGQVSRKVTDGAHLTPDRSDDGYLLLSARNVRNGYLDLSEVDYVPEDEYNRLTERCNPEPGDILMSCSGMGLGRPCVVPEGLEFALVRSAALIKLKDEVHSEFIEQALQHIGISK